MNIYVAGIVIASQDKKKPLKVKTELTAALLNQINEDAHRLLGKDAVVAVVMQEYALTPKAVSTQARRKSLGMLRKAMSRYDNMIFIPGTYASQEKYIDRARKRRKTEKITANYTKLFDTELVFPSVLKSDFKLLQNAIKKRMLENCIFMQNCAYLLTSTTKFKHKKSAPWYELDRMPNDTKKSGIYYIGADDLVKKVTVNQREMDVALFICREHPTVKYDQLKLDEHPPLLHVVVSASVTLKKDNLFGALNIHMDSSTGLCVFKNDEHCLQASIGEVRAAVYSTDNLSHYAEPIPVQAYNRQVGQQQITAQKAASPSLFSTSAQDSRKRARPASTDDGLNQQTNLKRR